MSSLEKSKELVPLCGDGGGGGASAEARAAALREIKALQTRVISSKKDLVESGVTSVGEGQQENDERLRVEKKLFAAKAHLKDLQTDMQSSAAALKSPQGGLAKLGPCLCVLRKPA